MPLENTTPLQAIVSPSAGAALNPNQGVNRLALFNPDGSALNVQPQTGANLPFAPITTATAIGTAAKTVTDAEPAVNTLIVIKFTSGNSAASPTVAFNGGSAKPVLLAGAAPLAAEATIAANGVGLFWYDGTSLHQVGALT